MLRESQQQEMSERSGDSTYNDIVYDLGKVLGVPEHIQRNIEFALNHSVVDVANHPLGPTVVLQVQVGESVLEFFQKRG